MLLNEYAPILIFAILAGVFPLATLWILKLIRPNPEPSAEKVMPYECGITPESDSRGRYTVRFDNGVEHTFLDGRHIEPLKKSLFRRK